MPSELVRTDLHMHSLVSDGTDSPAELLEQVRRAGLHIFSLTDHDAFLGCVKVRSLLRPDDPRFLTGVEFSCMDELGKYHILGYGYDPDSPAIGSVIQLGHSYRIEKLKERIEILREKFAIVFPEEEIRSLFSLNNPGKPHLANLMVRHGYVASKDLAFRKILNHLHSPNKYVRPEDAIRGILGAGGIPVLAHPCYGDGDQLILGQDLEDRVKRLMGFGLQGLEGHYSGFSTLLREQVLDLAERCGLYVTAGSDYHGGNKLIRLGDTGYTEDMPEPKGWTRFLEAAFPGGR